MKKHFFLSAIASAVISSSVIAAETNNSPEQEVEVITVSGDFRHHQIEDLPYTVSVISMETAEDRAAQHIEDVLNTVPNVNFSSGASRARYYQIRGIGERSQFVDPINPSVGVVIDGIDYSGIGSAAVMFDVEQVEVFRGPQGTRFGANALAGLINVRTQSAGNDQGQAKITLADYGTSQLGVATGGLITDTVGYRISAMKQKSDGYINNIYLNRDDTNKRDETMFRGKLAVELDTNSSLEWAVHYYDIDNGYDAFSLDNNRNTLSDEPGRDTQETTAASLTYNYSGMKKAELQITATTADSDILYGYDEDWSYVGIAPGWEYSSADKYYRDRKQHSLDIRFLSNEAGKILDNSTNWVLGAYWNSKDEELNRHYLDWDIYAQTVFSSEYETTNLALYGEMNTQLSDRLSVTSGFRVERFDADYTDSRGVNQSPDETLWGANSSLEYRTDNGLVYASVSKGYKPGGVNGEALGQAEKLNYAPRVKTLLQNNSAFEEEAVANYEIGYKGEALNGDFFYGVQAFYMDRQGVQIKRYYSESASQVDGDVYPSVFVGYLVNADVGSNKGIELEARYQMTNAVSLYASLGLLNTDRSGISSIDADQDDERELAHAPEYQYYFAIDWEFNHNWSAKVELEGKDGFYFSESHNAQADSINLLNANVEYLADSWSLALWARNLLDEEYPVRGFFFGNDPRDEYTDKTYTQLGEPAVVGVTFNYNF